MDATLARMAPASAAPDPVSPNLVSVIIPMINEAENVAPLAAALTAALAPMNRPFEVIFIDDGSTDGTFAALAAVAAADPRFKVIAFKRNVGQTGAMMAGIDHARGSVIVPMDGDLQNDPADIPKLLAKLDEGYGVVSGWRRDRRDAWMRTVLSRIANGLISWASGVRLNDYGCTLKAYRRDVLEGFRLYGEMHRFVPIYARWQGARITEMAVTHHPRRAGESKYGFNRITKVLLDLLVVKFLTQYETKPIYIFGTVGFGFFFLSFLAGLWAVYLKFGPEHLTFVQTPLPLIVAFGFITGVMCVLMGLLAEVLVRIYFEARDKAPYTVKERINFDRPA